MDKKKIGIVCAVVVVLFLFLGFVWPGFLTNKPAATTTNTVVEEVKDAVNEAVDAAADAAQGAADAVADAAQEAADTVSDAVDGEAK